MTMSPSRAKEIAASPTMMHVTHYGVPIYIESVLNDNASALVHPIDWPEHKRIVCIYELVES
jgi:small acid-soluble spore protein H (minor)